MEQSKLKQLLDECETLKTGFKVPVELKESQYGRGLFVSEDVPEGTEIWSPHQRYYKCKEDIMEAIEGAKPEEIAFFFERLYGEPDGMALCMDMMMFMNHGEGEEVNIRFSVTSSSIAKRDIKKGEELREAYQDFQPKDWFEALAKEMGLMTADSFVKDLQASKK